MDLAMIADWMARFSIMGAWVASSAFVSFILSKMIFASMTAEPFEMLTPRDFVLADLVALAIELQIVWAVTIAAVSDRQMAVWLAAALSGTVTCWWGIGIALLKTAEIERRLPRFFFLLVLQPVGLAAAWLLFLSFVTVPALAWLVFADVEVDVDWFNSTWAFVAASAGLPIEGSLVWGVAKATDWLAKNSPKSPSDSEDSTG